MKKTFGVLSFMVVGILLLNAMTVNIPPKVLEAFKAKYPGAEEVSWVEDGNEYIANFLNVDGYYADASFGIEGQWNETTTLIDEIDLPKAVADVIEQSFEKDAVGTVSRIERPAGLSFGIHAEVDEMYYVFEYTPDGKLLSKKQALG